MGSTNVFDVLPQDVFHFIFETMVDCKSLVRCMVVSKTFQQQLRRVTSLSITCHGQFSTYKAKLEEVYNMVRTVPLLKSLIVRVGPAEDADPPTTPTPTPTTGGSRCCVRYAELGTSVEKFIFMSGAKPGEEELGELDDDEEEEEEEEQQQQEAATTRRRRNASRVEKCRLRKARGRFQSFAHSRPSTTERASYVGSQCQCSTSPTSESTHLGDKDLLRENCGLRGCSLRQVVAPSSDVLKRMVPIIVFAIVQGLDEFRDCIPSFLENFTELKQFVFIDVVENVIVLMRDFHIEEIRFQSRHEKQFQNLKGSPGKQKTSLNLMRTNFIGRDEMLTNDKPKGVDTRNGVTSDEQDRVGYSSSESVANGTREHNKSMIVQNENTDSNLVAEVCENESDAVEDEKLKHEVMGVSNSKEGNELHHLTEHKSVKWKGKSPINRFEGGQSKFQRFEGRPPECKRCENLVFLGKLEPCWTCANRNSDTMLWEKMRSRERKEMAPMLRKGDTFGSSSERSVDGSKGTVMHCNESRGDVGSLRLRTYNNLFSVPKTKESSSDRKLSTKEPHTNAMLNESLHNTELEKNSQLHNTSTLLHVRNENFDNRHHDKRTTSKSEDNMIDIDNSFRKTFTSGPEISLSRSEEKNLIPRLLFSRRKTDEKPVGCRNENLNQTEEENKERQQERDMIGNFRFCRRRGRSSKYSQSANDVRTKREQQTKHEVAQLGLEDQAAHQRARRDLLEERAEKRLREMPFNTYEEKETEKEEVCWERSSKEVPKQQRSIEKENLFFDMSFWKSEKISTCAYCLLDVSICVATHGAKPLTTLELDLLSKTSLVGSLLVATIVHVNNALGLYNL